MKHEIELVLDDAFNGDSVGLLGLIDSLLDQGISLNRIVHIGIAVFGLKLEDCQELISTVH